MHADLLLINAKVYTVDDANPWAEAVAIRGTQILYVGPMDQAISYRGATTRVINGAGRTLLPGFIDSHFHLQWGSATLYGAQLSGQRTIEDLTKTIHAWMAKNPTAPWVIGEGVSYALPTKETPLTRHHLDAIVPNKPLVLTAFDQHSSFVNSAALAAAKITHGSTEQLANGTVVVDANGLATGELYEMDAMALINRARPAPDRDQQLESLRRGLALCASLGITSIHNMDGDLAQAALYASLEAQNELTLRIYLPFWAKPEMTLESALDGAAILREKYQSDLLRGGAIKFFMDGVYESFTAVTLHGYPGYPAKQVEPIWPAERFARFTTAADELGLQIAVHACGDGAVRCVLDGYAAARTANHKQGNRRESRHRIEHIEMIDPADLPRFAQLGVTASMQPLHSPLEEDDPDVWPTRVAPAAWGRAFAWRTLRDAGAHLVFGSDWPVVSANPMLGFYAARNRKAWRPGQPNHRQTLAEVVRSYTRDAAYAEFQEEKKGQIKSGLYADLVLMDRDIFDCSSSDLADVQVDLTICNGRIVFER